MLMLNVGLSDVHVLITLIKMSPINCAAEKCLLLVTFWNSYRQYVATCISDLGVAIQVGQTFIFFSK